MNIEDYLAELEGSKPAEKPHEELKQEKPKEEYGPSIRTLPARSRNVTCGICRKKLKPSEKYWCQTTEASSYWWCFSCIKP